MTGNHGGRSVRKGSGQPTGTVFDIRKFSIHDGPGIRTTVFLKGCPLACLWCHNPEGLTEEPQPVFRPDRCIRCGACAEQCRHGAIAFARGAMAPDPSKCIRCGACVDVCAAEARQLIGRRMGVDEVMAELEADRLFYDESGGGATFSGGEPLFQADFLEGLLRECRNRRIHATLDTSGHAPWETVDRIRQWVDLFLYDLKLVDDGKHRRLTGVSNGWILENLKKLSALGHPVVLRIPVIPGINDGNGDIRGIAEFASRLEGVERVVLLPYHRLAADKYKRLGQPDPLPGIPEPSAARTAEIAAILRKSGLPLPEENAEGR
jgi:pyruvate formate lyase activating enzyme